VKEPNKKIISMVIVLVVGGGLVCVAAHSNEPDGAAEQPGPDTDVSFLSDPNATQQPNLSLSNGELFFKMTLSVVLVAALGLGALYMSKRVLPRVTKASGKEIRIIETTYLGPRKAIHLVEVSNQKLLIGSTNESIAMLTHVGETWLDTSDPEANNIASL